MYIYIYRYTHHVIHRKYHILHIESYAVCRSRHDNSCLFNVVSCLLVLYHAISECTLLFDTMIRCAVVLVGVGVGFQVGFGAALLLLLLLILLVLLLLLLLLLVVVGGCWWLLVVVGGC